MLNRRDGHSSVATQNPEAWRLAELRGGDQRGCDRYVFTGYRDAASRNCKPTVMDALHAGAGVHQPVGTAASVRPQRIHHCRPVSCQALLPYPVNTYAGAVGEERLDLDVEGRRRQALARVEAFTGLEPPLQTGRTPGSVAGLAQQMRPLVADVFGVRVNVERYADVLVERAAGRGAARPAQ